MKSFPASVHFVQRYVKSNVVITLYTRHTDIPSKHDLIQNIAQTHQFNHQIQHNDIFMRTKLKITLLYYDLHL
jgi:hypothetical protein